MTADVGGGPAGAVGAPSGEGRPKGAVVVFVLPAQLRDVAGGQGRMEVLLPEAGTVEAAFTALRRERPGLWDRIFTEQRELRPHVNVFVDGADVRWTGGMASPVAPGSEVVVLPAVSGG